LCELAAHTVLTAPVCFLLSVSWPQGLDRETLAIVLALCDEGVNPEALAEVMKYLRREATQTQGSDKSAHVAKPRNAAM
jgi:Mitotic-spindle organizing gamma-tubulin ring associated